MTLILTSSPCVIGADRAILNPANGFLDRIREALPRWPRLLFVASNPDDHEGTCAFGNDMLEAFLEAGIRFASFQVLDGTNAHQAHWLVKNSDFIMLAGGHVPTQNRFLSRIRLRRELRDFPGLVMGISAGSMNCAELVYAQPEEPGESIAPEYRRFIPGLGLTDVNILPHYQQVKDNILDGVRLYEDITLPDSVGHTFYAIPDGSFYMRDEEGGAFFGEVYRIENGVMEWLTTEGEVLPLE